MWPAIIAGAASLLGGVMSNRATAKSVQRQMEFQEDMSNTAHQREVMDLRNAGLNPILSAGGRGASTPEGAHYQASDVLTPAVGSALAARENVANVNLKSEQVNDTKASVNQRNADSLLKTAQYNQAQQQVSVGYQQEKLYAAQAIRELEHAKNLSKDTETKDFYQREIDARIALMRAQTRTEAGRPALVAAETLESSARTAHVNVEAQGQRFRNVGLAHEADLDEDYIGDFSRRMKRLNPFEGFLGGAAGGALGARLGRSSARPRADRGSRGGRAPWMNDD